MLSREKKKMCWDCGGEAPESLVQCPFCGGDFSANKEQTIHPSINPYESNSDIPQAPYSASTSYEMSATEPEQQEETIETKEKERKSVIALSFLIPGITLLLLSMGIYFFSEEGYFTLRWDSSYGLFVFLISTVFIYLGARSFRKL